MKTRLISANRRPAGYALLVVLGITAASAIILAGTVSRTYTISKLNDRNNQYVLTMNAAEAAAEKAFARMAYDFSTMGQGLGAVSNNMVSGLYATNFPSAAENSYWTNFVFSNAQGNNDRTYVGYLNNYTGNLPSQFTLNTNAPLSTANAPVYRIVSNARLKNARYSITNAVQVDVLLALVPISNMAIFSNTNMEFVRCATLTVRGRTHANGSIYTGCLSSSTLNFNALVTCTGITLKTNLDGLSLSSLSGPVKYNAGKTTNVPPIMLSLNMTNTHSLIDMPPSGELATSPTGKERLYNKAQMVLLVSNTAVALYIRNGDIPGTDTSLPFIYTNNASSLGTNLPFLQVLWSTNSFYDDRESKTILASQIDLGRYKSWLATNSSVLTKFSVGSGTYPTILYVADNRTYTSGSQLTAIRITNNTALPVNGGLGFTLATPDPLYVWGHYNCTNSSHYGTTNTTATVPSALMSDALTVLSPLWKDSDSTDTYGTGVRVSTSTTINAAILAGLVYSTGKSSSTYSGGIYNIPRLLEDWGNNTDPNRTLTLNTSLLSLFGSNKATTQWGDPGTYYNAPMRNFNFDLNFLDPAKQPPGMPCALIPVRHSYATPPPNTVTYNVTP